MTQQGLAETSQLAQSITCLTAPVTSIVAVARFWFSGGNCQIQDEAQKNHRFFFGAADHKTWKRPAYVAGSKIMVWGLLWLKAADASSLLEAVGLENRTTLKSSSKPLRYYIIIMWRQTLCFSLWFLNLLSCIFFFPPFFFFFFFFSLMSYVFMSPVGSKISLKPELRSRVNLPFPPMKSVA